MTDKKLLAHFQKTHRQATRTLKSFKEIVRLHHIPKSVIERLLEDQRDHNPLNEEVMIEVLKKLPGAAQICRDDAFSSLLPTFSTLL